MLLPKETEAMIDEALEECAKSRPMSKIDMVFVLQFGAILIGKLTEHLHLPDPSKIAIWRRDSGILDLSIRARRALYKLGATTIGDLCKLDALTILNVRYIGEGTLRELREKLGKYSLALLGEDPEDWKE